MRCRVKMIQKQNIVIVMDTNVLADIVERTSTSRVDRALVRWIQSILDEMNEMPRERRITFLVSPSILDDYKTRLFKRGCKPAARSLKMLFNKTHNFKITLSPSDQKIVLSFYKISTDNANVSVSDKYDRRFFGALQNAKNMRRWEDRAIIFASCDIRSLKQIRDSFTQSRSHERLHFPANFDELNDSIAC